MRLIPWSIAAMLSAAVLLAATLAAAQSAGNTGDDTGMLAFNNACRTCHVVKEGDNRLGPSLFGVFGRKSGQAPGFQYSSTLADGSITWDEATLDRFIANPDAVAPGNNMKPYTGISDAADRKVIIDYLKTASAR